MTEIDIYRNRKAAPPIPTIGESLLVEIAEHLRRFAETGATHLIDLRGLPMSDEDRDALDERLGVGEIKADIALIGRSEAWETGYGGVWRVRHFGTAPEPVSDQIFIGPVPDILLTHREDALAAAARLDGENAEHALHFAEPSTVKSTATTNEDERHA